MTRLVKIIDFIGGYNPDLLRTIFRKVVGVRISRQ